MHVCVYTYIYRVNHVTVGHTTAMGTATFFGPPEVHT